MKAHEYAAELVKADRVSEARVKRAVGLIPLALLNDVVICLTALANKPVVLPVERTMPHEWTPEEGRKAHAAHTRGERNDWVTAGERYYQRERMRRRRTQQVAA